MRYRGRHFESGQELVVTVQAGQIQAVESFAGQTVDAHFDWLAPSLLDVQINGCLGHGFTSARLTEDDIRLVVAECLRHGIGQFCPTLITQSFEVLQHGFATLRRAVEHDAELARRLPCYHLEGPYLSAEEGPRGAHPLAHIRPPNWDEFQRLQEAAGGRIGMVTLAPEYEQALTFIEQLRRCNVVPAIGHTAASPSRIRDAVQAGARISTHLGNGAHALLPRHDNYIWEQLAHDDLWASLITDGHHLPASVMRCMLRVKTAKRVVLTCDAGSLAGLPAGRYRDWEQEFEVLADGKVIVPGTPFLAGSGVFLDRCVVQAVQLAGATWNEALQMATVRPRELLGLPLPRLQPGELADIWIGVRIEEKNVTIQLLA